MHTHTHTHTYADIFTCIYVVRPKLPCIMDSSSTILLCEITLSGSSIVILHLFNCRVTLRRLCLLRHRSGQVRLGSWIISFGLRGPSPQAFTPFRGGLGSLPGAWGAPNKGNADGAEGIFGKLRACVGYGPAPGPTQKGLVPYMPVRWGVHQIPQYHNTIVLTGVLVVRSHIRLPILDTTG